MNAKPFDWLKLGVTLVAVAVGTYVDSVRLAAVLAIIVVLAVVLGRTLRSPDRRAVLFG